MSVPALDHSSLRALLSDLERRPGAAFCFESRAGGVRVPWKLVNAEVYAMTWCSGPWLTLRLRIRFIDGGAERSWDFKPSPRHDGWLTGRDGEGDDGRDLRVLPLRGAGGAAPPDSADNSRRRLDDNLRRVFS